MRFTIRKEGNRPGFANWYVYGDRLDWSGDRCWGHFSTWGESLAFVGLVFREQTGR